MLVSLFVGERATAPRFFEKEEWMRFTFDLKLGDRVIKIEDEAATPAEVFKKIAFWDSLPNEGPAGELDLKFSYRTPKGYEYYAIECPSAGQEFKFGELKDKKGLFPKDWEKILNGTNEYEEAESEQPRNPEPRTDPGQATAAELQEQAEW